MNTKTKTSKEVKETNLNTVLIDLIYIIGFMGFFIFTMVSVYNN
jgi:hypothetical protein